MNSLIKNTTFGFRYKKWTLGQAFAYFAKGVARELHCCSKFWENNYNNVCIRLLKKNWLVNDGNVSYFDIKGAKLPDISANRDMLIFLACYGFEETFFISSRYNDNYDKTIVSPLDKYFGQNSYGYKDGLFDVTVQSEYIVIDAGAWIGDFSAYATSKGATVYAFEPVKDTFDWLCKTAKLNGENLYPVQKALGNSEGKISISIEHSGVSNSIVEAFNLQMNAPLSKNEIVSLTTLDKFVEENKLERVDFIKSDIEGAERDMLSGATHVLRTFAPKLAISTYHLPDDPQILEQIIKEANPDYTVLHLKNILFAMVVK
jgi:FkbM family methyltransferase